MRHIARLGLAAAFALVTACGSGGGGGDDTTCGDGVAEGAEQCDQGAGNGAAGSCCSAACAIAPAATPCRAAAAACDLAEVCDGAVATCPPDVTSCDEDPIAINAGGLDVAPFVADTGFTGGTPFTNWTGAIDTSGVAGAAPAEVYQSERYGDFSYAFAGLTPGASYLVRLHFCENYEPAADIRRFNVTINGDRVLDDFRVFEAAGGLHRAHVEEFTVSADAGGGIVVAFTGFSNNALVNGLEVRPRLEACGNAVVEGLEECDLGADNGVPGSGCTDTCTIEAGPCTDPPPPLPEGGSAVATFESLGLTWTPTSDPGAAGCAVRYRKAAECEWSEGLPLWYDAREGECRGALVHLAPGTAYVVQLGVVGQPFSRELLAATWSETFPVGETVYLPNGTSTEPLIITEGGTAGAYKLYTFPPGGQSTIDVGDAYPTNITISAPYVIIRGLTLRGAQQHGIRLDDGARDVVIEDNDISGWGRIDTDAGSLGASSVVWGVYADSGIYSSSWLPERIIIQRNRIHHPRTDSNSWGEYRTKYSSAHPRGPNGIYLIHTAGNHVIRYNDIWSDLDHMYNDVMGGDENFSDSGFPNRDSDIYGNWLGHAWDDAIEAEGGNRNVRIWGNYMDRTATGIATSSTYFGPIYVFRNVYNRSRTDQTVPLDEDNRLYFGKYGSVSPWGGGRRYVFHNTLLQATDPSATLPLGAGTGISGNGAERPIENTVTRNNIFHVWKPWWASIATEGGSGNDLDYDLYNGDIDAYAGAEPNGIDLGDSGAPEYAPGHGWTAEHAGSYQLAPGTAGHDDGAVLPNFNDGYEGAAPDMGAHEAGSPDLRIGACAGPAPVPAFCP